MVNGFFASGAVRPIYDQRGILQGYIKVARDITARKKLQDDLEIKVTERTSRLQELVREMEAFSYSISHDLRAPLRSISGFANVALVRGEGKLDPEIQDALHRILNSTGHAEALIQDVLDYSRIVRSDVRPSPLDLEELVREVVRDQSAFQSGAADIQIRAPLNKAIGHRASLYQAIANLLTNAVKFVSPGTKPKVGVWSENQGAKVRLWIEDNGIGIPPDEFDRIFALFERGTSSSRYEGTGIGLAIVRKAMERMGGAVGVQSEPGRGSRFWLELPGP